MISKEQRVEKRKMATLVVSWRRDKRERLREGVLLEMGGTRKLYQFFMELACLQRSDIERGTYYLEFSVGEQRWLERC